MTRVPGAHRTNSTIMGTFVDRLAAMEHRVAILEKRVAELESKSGDLYLDVEKLPKGFLPKNLELGKTDVARLNRLIRTSYIKVCRDGHLFWNSECDTELALVIGRLWSGDRKVGASLKRGGYTFPSAGLERLFKKKNLRKKREQIFLRSLTDWELDIYDIMENDDRG